MKKIAILWILLFNAVFAQIPQDYLANIAKSLGYDEAKFGKAYALADDLDYDEIDSLIYADAFCEAKSLGIDDERSTRYAESEAMKWWKEDMARYAEERSVGYVYARDKLGFDDKEAKIYIKAYIFALDKLGYDDSKADTFAKEFLENL